MASASDATSAGPSPHMLSTSTTSPLQLTVDYSIVLPKRYVNMHAIDLLKQRVSKLSVPTPGLVRYLPSQQSREGESSVTSSVSGVSVSPLYVTIKADAPARQLFKAPLRELSRNLPEDEALGELTRMARVVMNLHRHGIIHGRLTLDSWREDDYNELFIVDAAVPIAAMPYSAPMLQSVAHLLAPEIVAAAGGGDGAAESPMLVPQTDVWGLVVCYLQLILPEKRIATMDRSDILDADVMCPLITHLPPQIVSMLVRCLKPDPMQRPSAEELYCELLGQPNARQAAMFAAMQNEEIDTSDSEGDYEEHKEEEGEESSSDEESDS